MQQDADFITSDSLYMFRASCAHHQECKTLTPQPPVLVVMVAGGSSLHQVMVKGSEAPPAAITTCTGGCRVSILYF
jgi:hypothetical protein